MAKCGSNRSLRAVVHRLSERQFSLNCLSLRELRKFEWQNTGLRTGNANTTAAVSLDDLAICRFFGVSESCRFLFVTPTG